MVSDEMIEDIIQIVGLCLVYHVVLTYYRINME